MQTKKCTKCLIEKELTDFYFNKSRNAHYPRCKECRKDYANSRRRATVEKAREWAREYRQKNLDAFREREYNRRRKIYNEIKQIIETAKTNAKCVDCGFNYPLECLDFDHRPGTNKRFNICDGIHRGGSPKRWIEEIQKCDIVCANCHRIRTFKRYERKEKVSKHILLRRKKLDLVNDIKKNTPCAICNRYFETCQMDFDHLGDKDKDVCQLARECKRDEVILAEIAKCRLLCANCHRTHSKEQRNRP